MISRFSNKNLLKASSHPIELIIAWYGLFRSNLESQIQVHFLPLLCKQTLRMCGRYLQQVMKEGFLHVS